MTSCNGEEHVQPLQEYLNERTKYISKDTPDKNTPYEDLCDGINFLD